MKGDERKAAVAAYKERKVVPGIYLVRCAPTGQVWVGAAPDLSTIRNRIWFTLRQRVHTDRLLQQAWNEQGAESFAFEVAEALEPEDSAYVRGRLLKARLAHWIERAGAHRL